MRNRAGKGRKAVVLVIFIVYIGLLLYFLFFSDRFGRTEVFSDYRYNLKPFSEVKRYFNSLNNGHVLNFIVNILGNIFVFAPFGYLVPCLLYGTGGDKESGIGLIGTLVISCSFSLAVELLQLFTRVGVFDVDDIIMNTMGGAIGYLIYTVFGKMEQKLRTRGNSDNERR